MSRSPQGNKTGLVVLALVAISFLVFGVLLGPGNAFSIASSASATTVLDGFAEQPSAEQLPELNITMSSDAFAQALKAEARTENYGTVMLNGAEYSARISFDPGKVLHHKRTFQLQLIPNPTDLPFRTLEVKNPSSADMLQEHMALWVAGEIGVPVPYDALYQVRINSREMGVMEMREVVGPDLEQARGLAPSEVAVSTIGPMAELPRGDSLANVRAAMLFGVLNDEQLTAYARKDSIALSVDMDAVLRYLAAVEVLHTANPDHAWVLARRSGKFYPVLCNASIMDEEIPVDTAAISIMARLATVIAVEPEWHARKESYISEAKSMLLANDLFLDKWRQAEARLIPSLLRDHEKHARIVVTDPSTYGYSIRRAVRTSATFRDKAVTFWRNPETAKTE